MARRRRTHRDHSQDQHHHHDHADDCGQTIWPFSISVATEEDARHHLHQRLASHEWWVIPAVSENAVRVAEVVEARHFPGRTGGFEALILSERVMGVCAVALARKRSLPARQLNALLRELGGPRGCEAGGDQDVVVALDPPAGGARERSIARTVAFAGWLAGGAA